MLNWMFDMEMAAIRGWLFICAIVLLMALHARAEETYGDVDLKHAGVTVHDGDTLDVDVPEWPAIIGRHIGVRIRGIDTAELRDPVPEIKAFAEKTRDYLADKVVHARYITLHDLGRDKYFRLLATLELDGVDIADDLIAKGYAKPYMGETKDTWTVEDVKAAGKRKR